MGKGSARRPTNEAAFQANYDAIFGKKEAQQIRNAHDEILKETMLAFQRSALRVQNTLAGGYPLCQHPETCANSFCNCEVKHENL